VIDPGTPAPVRFTIRDADCEVGDRYAAEIAKAITIAQVEFGPEVWAKHSDAIIDNGKSRLPQ